MGKKMENKAEIAIEKIKTTFELKSNLAASQFLEISNSTLQSWLQRNSFGQIYETLCNLREAGKISLSVPIESFFTSHPIEKPEPQNQKLQSILDDLLCFYGTEEETAKELEIYLIDRILDRFSGVANEAIAKFLDSLIFIDGDPIRARPFLFLYYIFHIIVTQKEEMPEENFKAFVIQKINDFKIFSSENNPGFTIKIKNAVIEVIEVKFSEDECRNLVKNAPTVLNLLEKRMPMSLVKTHKNKFN